MNKISVSVRGASHLKDGKPRQDFAKAQEERGYSYFAVADGHGGEKYFRSNIGSQYAVLVAEKEFQSFWKDFIKLKGKNVGSLSLEKSIQNICNRIIRSWSYNVRNHIKKHPLKNEEIYLCGRLGIPLEQFEQCGKEKDDDSSIEKVYGTTLIAGIYIHPTIFPISGKEALWIALQIGDGMCLAKKAGSYVFCPIPEDEKLGFGMTTSLCSDNAVKEFRYAWGFDKLDYICACTDGVQDSFTPEGLRNFTNDIYHNIQEYSADRERKELEDFFPRLSEQGSGDDVSLAGIFGY